MNVEVKTDGKFKYVEEGEGQVVVLLHGLFGALSNFNSVLNHFSSGYKVVIPLLPLYEMSLMKTNVKGLLKYVHEFMEHKDYNSVTLLGNSLGGHIALMYALHYPERCNSMVLTGSSGLYENAMGGSFPRRQDYNYIKEKVEYTFHDPKMASKELVDECFETVNDRGRIIRILALAKSAIRHNMSNDLQNIHIPTCLIWGKNDRITPPYVAEEFQELLPDAELHFIDECGHAPMMEQPEAFNKVLARFLAKQYADSPKVER